ncbi:MAG TPA: HrpJ domain-containing protein [Chlamydiales bacterium]|jgi:type III secretion protein W|nr:HrpJ domain-containing protein [Chlamydiales bacterium]
MSGGPIISRAIPLNLLAAQELAELALAEDMRVIDSQENFATFNDTNVLALFRNFRTLQEIKTAAKERTEVKEEDKKTLMVEKIEEIANNVEQRNKELKARTLLILRSSITDQDTPEEALNKTLRVYSDESLADEALDFLIETSEGDLQKTLKLTKEQFNQTYGREILAGRNIGVQVKEFSQEGLGSPTSLRDLYRDITGNLREPLKLFEELTEKFRYDKLSTVISFLLHALGADLKAKGSSILRAELLRLINDIRSLQGIMGIFRFFQSRMRIVERLFGSYNLTLPPRVTFEVLARVFAKLLAERFINPEKILGLLRLLGLSEEEEALLIICTQFRDAVKQIAPRYYRNTQHRDELLKAILDTLDQLEDELEDEDEKEK